MTHVPPLVPPFIVTHWPRGISAPQPPNVPSITASRGAKSAADDRPTRMPHHRTGKTFGR